MRSPLIIRPQKFKFSCSGKKQIYTTWIEIKNQDKKIEVISERDVWKRTANIAIEYQCYGKPSGINATEADYWFHNLCVGEDVYATLVFKTENLKKIIDSLERKVSVSGGDHNASRMYLVSLQKLFDVKTIKEYISL